MHSATEATMPSILVVDDVENNRNVISRQLQRRNYEIREASNGQDALKLIAQERVSLILLDINMPGMDGFEVLQTVRSSLGEQAPPIIMLTAVDDVAGISRALELGAKDYVAKPYTFQVLESRIKAHIRQADNRDRIKSNAAEALRRAIALKDERTTDALTGLPTRQQLEHRLTELLRPSSTTSTGVSIVHLDLDGFRAINDAYGLAEGDRLLRQIAVFLYSRIRSTDFLSRSGGDSFTMLLGHCGIESTEKKVRNLLHDLSECRLEPPCDRMNITASAGIVATISDFRETSEVMSAMESACRIAKERGRNRYIVYRNDNRSVIDMKDTGRWAVRIRNAIRQDGLVLFAQPIRKTTSGPAGNDFPAHNRFEILLRMRERDELISPARFLPAAAEHGLSIELDRWVFDRTYDYLLSLPASVRENIKRISINLAGQSLAGDILLTHIQKRILTGSVYPGMFCFEITETAALSDMERATLFMRELGAIGVSFALDDFGTGVSSFAYLKSLPVDCIKIDGQFVRNITSSPVDRTIVSAINQIAHIMGKTTIAEFVESRDIVTELRNIGVDYLQGYHIGKPAPLDSQVQRLPPECSSGELS